MEKDKKPRFFWDMDGTLCEFHYQTDSQAIYQKGYFDELAPHTNIVETVRKMVIENPENVYVLSAVLTNSPYARTEKNVWLDKYLPEIDNSHRIFVPCGMDKAKFVPHGITKEDFLFDDYTANLQQWASMGGTGIKVVNAINNRNGRWKDSKISITHAPTDTLAEIKGFIGLSGLPDNKIGSSKQNRMEKQNILKDEALLKKEELLGQANQMLEDLCKNFIEDPQTILDLLQFKSRFYQYSLRNTILIYDQNPGASFAGSYSFWNKNNYRIKRGEHGLKIFRPIIHKYLKESEEHYIPLSQAKKCYPDLYEKYKKNEIPVVEKLAGFAIAYVFDITQTNCPPEDFPKYFDVGHPDGQLRNYYDALKTYAEDRLKVSFLEEDIHSISIRGENYVGQHKIRINEILDDSEKFSVATHEIGHQLLHQEERRPTDLQEFQADVFSILVSQNLGVEISDLRKRHLVNAYRSLLKNAEYDKDNFSTFSGLVSEAFDVFRREIPYIRDYIQFGSEITCQHTYFHNTESAKIKI